MAIFEDREKGFEHKYKHDQELEFKIKVRANKMLGLWIAGQLGIPAGEAEAYAQSVVTADFERPGDDDVVEKVMADYKSRGVEMTEHRLRLRMAEMLAAAREQLTGNKA